MATLKRIGEFHAIPTVKKAGYKKAASGGTPISSIPSEKLFIVLENMGGELEIPPSAFPVCNRGQTQVMLNNKKISIPNILKKIGLKNSRDNGVEVTHLQSINLRSHGTTKKGVLVIWVVIKKITWVKEMFEKETSTSFLSRLFNTSLEVTATPKVYTYGENKNVIIDNMNNDVNIKDLIYNEGGCSNFSDIEFPADFILPGHTDNENSKGEFCNFYNRTVKTLLQKGFSFKEDLHVEG